MRGTQINKRKIFNDPVYGFITIPDELVFDLIEHPWFQRLRRIKQLGLTHLVYPGALHTRFHHSLGAMHLTTKAVNELRLKGHDISTEEARGVATAMLLHDIGHGPFSHTLENSIVTGISHETISLIFMHRLNKMFDGKLELALHIFQNKYPKGFLHKLVSGQFDMDRLDYLKRDSFFTGVSEGIINYERLLNMIDVHDDNLVIESKGIYSAEKFITARRLMYWQVYLHKTVLVSEFMLMRLLKRAKQLRMAGEKLFATPALDFFLKRDISEKQFLEDPSVLEHFSRLDDFDIFTGMKVWTGHPDKILSTLSKSLVNRRLFRIELQNTPFEPDYLKKLSAKIQQQFSLTDQELDYFVFHNETSNCTYQSGHDNINILFKDGSIVDITEASDELNISLLSKPVTKYFLCYPKGVVSFV
ncbi:MAG: HD domain-containing protein [Bacteroidales bacterium]|nr:HD domain-containing protein [Bacteroidales bacterium]